MFGKKEPKFNQLPDLPQLPQLPEIQFNQPINQNQMQTIQQPQQQFQQFQRKGLIIKGEMSEEGEFTYIIQTNYPLSLGNCDIRNI